MEFTTVDVIYNPNSTGPSARLAKTLAERLRKAYPDIPVELHKTAHAGHAKKIAYNQAQKSERPLIISSSGDGGYNEVINGMMQAKEKGADPICMVLAAGNANDHSRTIYSKSVLSTIKKGKIAKLDLLKISYVSKGRQQVRYAHSYIGLGMTPEIAKELNKTNLNRVKETLIAIKTFVKLEPFVILRNGRKQELDSLIFTTIGQMAKLLTIAKNSKPDDGKFEVVRFPHAHKVQLMRKVTEAALIGIAENRSYTSYSFEVTKSMPVQLDGEVIHIDSDSKVEIRSAKHELTTIL